MNIGLSFLQQIKDAFTVRSFTQLSVAVTTGYHREHNTNDTHKTITASGSISERTRSIPLGVWIDVQPASVVFSSGAGGGWVANPSNVALVSYTLIGTTMIVAWNITRTSVVAAPATLAFMVSNVATPTKAINGTFHYNNAGTYGVGRCSTAPLPAGAVGVKITLYLVNLANWAASVSNTDVTGQMAFEVSGV